MKEENIRIRIDSKLKKDFMNICEFENTTLSNKLNQFIMNEVKMKLPQKPEQQIIDLLPHDNIVIVDRPIFVINSNGSIVDNDSEGHVVSTQTFVGDITEFLTKNKNKKVYLFLSACDFKNKIFRITTI